MTKAIADRTVHIGPANDPVIAAAVQAAGATVVHDPTKADSLVWLSPDLDALRATLHDGIDWVQVKMAGVDNIIRSGIVDDRRHWTCARGAYADAVAEHGLTLMLAATRRLHEIVRAGNWGAAGSRFGRILTGRTVTIIGCGAIGEALMRYLAPFDVTVHAVTRSGRTVAGAHTSVASDDADGVIAAADFVVLSAPSTEQTVGFMDSRRLGLMQSSAWLVNIGRGDLVDTDDLVSALQARSIAGAALDVTDPEPLPDDHPLWQLDNVLITPHTSNPPETNSETLAQRTVDNLERLAAGDELLGVIDPHKGY